MAALRRSIWLIAIVLVLGVAIGVVATRVAAPVYEAQARLWIAADQSAPNTDGVAPIRAAGIMRQTAWPELLTSFAVLDPVAQKTGLNVVPATTTDTTLFANFHTAPQFRAGAYQLRADTSGWQYQLLDGHGKVLQSGVLGDSVGQAFGIRWRPTASGLAPGGVVKFTVLSTRDAAEQLRRNLSLTFDPRNNLLGVTLAGTDPERTAAVLNSIIDEFRMLVGQLKSQNASEVTRVLKQQVDYEDKELRDAETQLQQFDVQQATVSGGQSTQSDSTAKSDPVFENYLSRKLERDSIRREREALEQTVSAIRAGSVDPGVLWMLPPVRAIAPPELHTALLRLDSTEAELQSATAHYTDDHSVVQGLREQIDDLRSSRIPSAVSGVLVELGRRERGLDALIGGLAQQLRLLPVQSTQEARLRRNVETHARLYETLRHRYEEASLAERGTSPDVTVLDPVVVPSRPSTDRMPFVIALALMVSVGVALALAVARDRLDSRFRYPEQAVDDLGLEVLGMMPRVTRGALGDGQRAAQVTEGFRAIRLAVANALSHGDGLTVTVSSPAPGDGKSFVSANLALSFAAAGTDTLLVDADLRRGELHRRFGLDATPGLTDWLAGEAPLEDTLRLTTDAYLTVMPRGTVDVRAPELLNGDKLKELVAQLRERFAAIIIDSPPLGVGIDALLFGGASGNMMLVLRAGETDRRVARAQLRTVGRLPIHVIGAVLNDVSVSDAGAYQYYGYMDSNLRNGGSDLVDVTRQAEFARRSGLVR
jgi:tyrosine-protein kinase Etk/Wzc